METSCFAVVLPAGKGDVIPLKAGDDAKRTKWWHLSDEVPEVKALYASHHSIIAQALRKVAADDSVGSKAAVAAAVAQVAQ